MLKVKNQKELNLEIDRYYSDWEVIELGLSPISNCKMDYKVYEKDNHVYFFEEVDKYLLRLYCFTSKKSFYL